MAMSMLAWAGRGTNTDGRVTRRRLALLARFVRPHWKTLVGALALLLVNAGLKLPMPFLSIYLVDTVIPSGNVTRLWLISAAIAGMTVIYLVMEAIKAQTVLRMSRKVAARIETYVLKRVQELPIGVLHAKDTGYILSRFVHDLAAVNGLTADTLLLAIQHVTTLIVGVAAVFYIHPQLALISISILPGFGILNFRYGRTLRRQMAQAQELRAQLVECLNETLSGALVAKVFARERGARARVFHRRAAVIRAELTNNVSLMMVSSMVSLLGSAGPLIVLAYGGFELIHGRLTIGELIGFNAMLVYLHGPTQSLTNLYVGAQHGLAALDRVGDLVELPSEPGLTQAGTHTWTDGPPRAPSVTFSGVSFGYDPARPVLNGVTFTVAPASITAIVGESGAGKSSIVNLLFRLYEPDAGRIAIDGVDIRDFELRALRRGIGLVSQETILFTGSILENIRFGQPRATMSNVVEAAILANADAFIRSLPRGYDTPVGRMGYQLSAGQRQRIALARTILCEPALLVLDEATSSIDSSSEHLIWETLAAFVRTRTAIIISHRLSSVQRADTVVYLRNGVIAACGSQRQMEEDPSYRSLYVGQVATTH